MTNYEIIINILVKTTDNKIIKEFNLKPHFEDIILENEIAPLNNYYKISSSAFYPNDVYLYIDQTKNYLIHNKQRLQYTIDNLIFESKVLLFKDNAILTNDYVCPVDEYLEFSQFIEKYSDTLYYHNTYHYYVLNETTRDLYQARRCIYSGYYRFLIELFDIQNGNYPFQETVNKIRYLKNYLPKNTIFDHHDELELINYLNHRINQNTEWLEKKELNEQLFLLCDNHQIINTKVIALNDFSLVFENYENVEIIEYAKIRTNLNKAIIALTIYNQSKSEMENYQIIKNLINNNALSSYNSRNTPNYEFSGSAEIRDTQAWENYCLENNMIHYQSELQLALEFIKWMEELIIFLKILNFPL